MSVSPYILEFRSETLIDEEGTVFITRGVFMCYDFDACWEEKG